VAAIRDTIREMSLGSANLASASQELSATSSEMSSNAKKQPRRQEPSQLPLKKSLFHVQT